MIAGATRGAGGPALARHLLSRKGQQVRVLDARHLAAADLGGQLRELVTASRHGRTDRPAHHIHVDPPPGSDAEAVTNIFMREYEREFGLEEVQRCGVEHVKAGRCHYHIVYSLVQPTGKVADLSHEYARREKVSRITEFECGLPFVQGKHNRAVARALREDGRSDIADAMEAAGLLGGRRPIAEQTPRERAQAERTDVPIAEVRATAFAAWQASDSDTAFAAALAEGGLRLAAGDRGAVLIDRSGAAHSLSRVLSAAARAEGSRITAATVRERLAGHPLPAIEEAKDHVRRPAVEPGQTHLPGSTRSASDQPAAPAASWSSRRARGIGLAGRDQGIAEHDRRDPRPTIAGIVRDQDRRRTRWTQSDRVAARRLRSLDLATLQAQANRTRLAPACKAVRDRVAAQALARIDIRATYDAALHVAAGSLTPHSHHNRGNVTMKRIPGFRGFHPGKQDYKTSLLSGIVPNFDVSPWADDLHRIDRDSPKPRLRTRDGGWIELDPKARTVKTWGKTGRATALAAAIADSQGWDAESLPSAGSIAAAPERPALRRSAEELESWWRERGYDAVGAEDGVWVDVGSGARLQDIGDQVRLHGALTHEAARAMILKAVEAWGGDAELSGAWSQADKDVLWLEAQRSGVRLGSCEPSAKAKAAREAESAEAAQRADTLGMVKSATGPARLLLNAAAGDVSALSKLDPDLRAFVASYLDDDQRAELAMADIADVISELHRFRELGCEERAKTERERDVRPANVRDSLDVAPPPVPAPGL